MPKRKALPQTDVIASIRSAFPHGIIELVPDPGESYLGDAYRRLKAELSRIKGAIVRYERQPAIEPCWNDNSDREEDPPDWQEPSYSYHLFFVSPTDKRFEIEVEARDLEDDGETGSVAGRGHFGCCVGVSIVAPYAVVKLDEMVALDDGSEMLPDIHTTSFAQDGTPIEPEACLGEQLDADAMCELGMLRDKIVEVLKSCGIALLSNEQARAPVPGIVRGEGIVGFTGTTDKVTVMDALFFMEP